MNTEVLEIAKIIDHTQLRPDADERAYEILCREAREHRFHAVCIPPSRITLCCKLLDASEVRVATVIGFPHGYGTTQSKAAEAAESVRLGATELDMVINLGILKDGASQVVEADIAAVVRAAGGALVKVIIEAGLLTDDEKRTACRIAESAGADFVKNSTGFAGGPATEEDVRLMRQAVGPRVGVKASGGIRDHESAVRMIKAGANRLGCSASVSIVEGSKCRCHA